MSTEPTSRAERLAQRVRDGDRRALGRALTLAENGGEDGKALLDALRGDIGRARVIGFTGPPGAGKSTLVDALIHEWRRKGQSVAVLAVDPVSPISGGAVLGDRTRMGAHSLDDGVFIRSVSARGHLGGLCLAAQDMADVMDAAGWPLILIETVGAGQSETEISQVADLSVVISAPGLGDELQAIKAGILEIADVLVVNKADRDDAEQTAKHLEAMLSLRAGDKQGVSVLRVAASTGLGVAELCRVLDDRLEAAGTDRAARRNARKLAIEVQRLAGRITESIAGKDIGSLEPEELERVVKQSLAALAAASRN